MIEYHNPTVSMSEAAKLVHVTRQAIFKAIKEGGLKAEMINGRWRITLKDLEDYRWGRNNRSKSKVNNQYIYDIKKGKYSINHASKLLGIDNQHLYYLIRKGRIVVEKIGHYWVISHEEVAALREAYNNNNNRKAL